MRDLYKEYIQGIITWEEAYLLANNNAANVSSSIHTSDKETDYWCQQMESLAVDLAEEKMRLLGYFQRKDGIFYKAIE